MVRKYPSDHCVVKLTLGYDVYAGTTCNVQFTKGKLAWHKAKYIDIQRYRSELDALLAQCTLSNEIMQCIDVNCTCESHRLSLPHTSSPGSAIGRLRLAAQRMCHSPVSPHTVRYCVAN